MSLLLTLVVKPSLVLVAAFVLLHLLRRQAAATRHAILAMALGVAALQPALGAILPALRMLPPAAFTAPATLPAGSRGFSAAAHAGHEVTATTAPFEIVRVGESASVTDAVVWVWLAGISLHAAVLLAGLVRLRALRRRGQPGADVWVRAAASAAQRLGVIAAARSIVTDMPAVLVTYGVGRPVILLPAGANEWPTDRVGVVAAHEAAHLCRRDWVVQLGAELARAIYWFNPLFWAASRRLRLEAEHACDDLVLATGIDGPVYATHLVDLVRMFRPHQRSWLPAPAMARPSTLERRVVAMLNPHLNRRPLQGHSRVAVALAIVAISLPLAALSQPWSEVSGTLRDASGRPLPEVTVRLSPIGGSTAHEMRTDGNGRFQFPPLAPGDYQFSARRVGFASVRQPLRLTEGGGPVDLTLTLEVGTLQETVNVTAAAVTSDTRARAAYTPPPCTPTEVGGQIVAPRKLTDVRPVYPPSVADDPAGGTVLLQARIGLDGRVAHVEPVSSVSYQFEEAAIDAVRQWEFSPTLLNCEPVEVRMFVVVSFKTGQ